MGLVSWFRKILIRQETVEELGDEEYNKPGEVDDNSRGVYSRGKHIMIGGVLTKLEKLGFIGKGRNH